MTRIERFNGKLNAVTSWLERWLPWVIPLGTGYLFLYESPLSLVAAWLCFTGAANAALGQVTSGLAWLIGRLVK